jgi:hypothetical protein
MLQYAVWMPAVSQRQLAVGLYVSPRLNLLLLLQVHAWAGRRASQLHQGPCLAGTSSKDTGCTGRAGADQRRRSLTMAILIPHVELQVQHRKRTGGVVQMLGVYTVLSSIGEAAPPTGALAANTQQACKQLKYGCVVWGVAAVWPMTESHLTSCCCRGLMFQEGTIDPAPGAIFLRDVVRVTSERCLP